jgi:hypothetical protein
MREHSVNELNNFIGGWYLDDTTICDRLIEYHRTSNNKNRGTMYNQCGDGVHVDTNHKDSVDVVLNDQTLSYQYYFDSLLPVTNMYKKEYTYCNETSVWDITENVNIQHYMPNGGIKVWHTERLSGTEPYSKRHLVFMTYLNDVTDGGETEFYYQKLKIKPEKGLTLIWGADWTFTHRGVVSPSQEKYIVTGWFSFL